MHQREIIVNGLRYFSYGHDARRQKGFGGNKWTIRFHDGALLRTNDIEWDRSFKNHSRPDTAIIVPGWGEKLPMFGYVNAGDAKILVAL